MPYASNPYASSPYAAVGSADATPPGQVLPPPVPGGTTVYYWSTQRFLYPLSWGGLSGARPGIVFLPGGIVIVPDPETGVNRVMMWWPNADALQLVRIDPDGARRPVRGGYGIAADATRTNYATNPGFEIGLNGYVPGAGSPTLDRPADPDAPAGTYVGRATIAGAGSCGVTVPTTLTGSQPVTVGFDTRLTARPTALHVDVTWTDSGGSSLGTTTIQLAANDINRSVAQFGRQVAQHTPPAGAVTPTIKIVADGLPAGAAMSLDGITIEQGLTDGSRFDGDILGASWTGTAGLSTSLLADVLTVEDREAPLDALVTYIVTDPSISGGQATSPPVVLASLDRSWITHPALDAPFRVSLRRKPTLTRPIARGVLRPLNRRNAVVVTGPSRQSPEGPIEINVLSAADRTTLLAALDDGQPILLRAPADYNWDPRWLSLGDLSEDPEDRLAYQDAWLLSSDFVEVDEPSAVA